MSAIDDFKAEYARQHPQRPALKQLSDESLVWAALMDKQADRIAAIEAQLRPLKPGHR